jgi:hypothetical protein
MWGGRGRGRRLLAQGACSRASGSKAREAPSPPRHRRRRPFSLEGATDADGDGAPRAREALLVIEDQASGAGPAGLKASATVETSLPNQVGGSPTASSRILIRQRSNDPQTRAPKPSEPRHRRRWSHPKGNWANADDDEVERAPREPSIPRPGSPPHNACDPHSFLKRLLSFSSVPGFLLGSWFPEPIFLPELR